MKDDCYFENTPWQQACERFLSLDTAEGIAEITVQCACYKSELPQTISRWDERLSKLLGKIVFESRLTGDGLAVILRRYQAGAIVRIFVDEAVDVSENFEIAGKKCLAVWRPDSRPQAHVSGVPQAFCDCAQLYSTDLGVL